MHHLFVWFRLSEPIQEVEIQEQGLGRVKRLSMMRIIVDGIRGRSDADPGHALSPVAARQVVNPAGSGRRPGSVRFRR